MSDDKVVQLLPSRDIPTALRNIADQVEQGLEVEAMTIIGFPYVWSIGDVTDDRCIEKVVFDCHYGIHWVMDSMFYEEVEE